MALLGHRLPKTHILILVKIVRPAFFSTVVIGVGTTAMGFCSREEKFGSTPNMTRETGDLQLRSRIGEAVSGWKFAKTVG